MTRCRKVSLVQHPPKRNYLLPRRRLPLRRLFNALAKGINVITRSSQQLDQSLRTFYHSLEMEASPAGPLLSPFHIGLFDHSQNVVYNQAVRSAEGGILTLWLLSIAFPLYQ